MSWSQRAMSPAVGVLFLDVVLVFSLVHLTPGDPAQMIVGDERGGGNVAQLRQNGLEDQPFLRQVIHHQDLDFLLVNAHRRGGPNGES